MRVAATLNVPVTGLEAQQPALASITLSSICTRQNMVTIAKPTTISKHRIGEEQRRWNLLRRFDALIAQGLSRVAAVKAVGASSATIWRYQRMAEKGSLAPRTEHCGRKPGAQPT